MIKTAIVRLKWRKIAAFFQWRLSDSKDENIVISNEKGVPGISGKQIECCEKDFFLDKKSIHR